MIKIKHDGWLHKWFLICEYCWEHFKGDNHWEMSHSSHKLDLCSFVRTTTLWMATVVFTHLLFFGFGIYAIFIFPYMFGGIMALVYIACFVAAIILIFVARKYARRWKRYKNVDDVASVKINQTSKNVKNTVCDRTHSLWEIMKEYAHAMKQKICPLVSVEKDSEQ